MPMGEDRDIDWLVNREILLQKFLLKRGIKNAKATHKQLIEDHFKRIQPANGARPSIHYRPQKLSCLHQKYLHCPPQFPNPSRKTEHIHQDAIHYYSSAFNTIIPCKLNSNLNGQGPSSTLCYWTLYFLSDHPQTVRLCTRLSFTLTLRPGTPHISCWDPSSTPSSCMIVHLHDQHHQKKLQMAKQ